MVRISGGGRGMRHIRAHLAYITRNGKLPAFDQNDDRFQWRGDLAELGQELQVGGFPIAESSEKTGGVQHHPVDAGRDAGRRGAPRRDAFRCRRV
jgi:hypothetical protein